MERKVEIIQLQQEIIDKHNEVWKRVFELMAEGKLVEAKQLVDSIDNSEFESLQNEFESLGAEGSEEDAAKQGQNHVKSELKRVSSGNGKIRAGAKGTCRESRSISQCSLQGPSWVLCKT